MRAAQAPSQQRGADQQKEGRAEPAPKQPEPAKLAPITPQQKAETETIRQAMVREAERAEAGRRPREQQPPPRQAQPSRGKEILAKHGPLARDVLRAWVQAPGKPIEHDKVKQAVNADRQALRAGREISR